MIENFTFVQRIVIQILPLLFAITVHEASHGWMAARLGDKTAQILGRLTLNPLKHIDLFGTVLVPLILLWMGGVMFGWAKPVPINPRNFGHPRRDLALVSLAGPLSNFIMAILWACVAKLGTLLIAHGFTQVYAIVLMGQAGIFINLLLMILNLIPIPPLDGSKIIASFLPGRIVYYYDKLEPFGFYILLFLIITQLLNYLVLPPIAILYRLIAVLFGFH